MWLSEATSKYIIASNFVFAFCIPWHHCTKKISFAEAYCKRLAIQNQTCESALVYPNSVAPHIQAASQVVQAFESSCPDAANPVPNTLQYVQYRSRLHPVLRWRNTYIMAGDLSSSSTSSLGRSEEIALLESWWFRKILLPVILVSSSPYSGLRL